MQQSFIIPNLEKINVMDLMTCEQIAKKKKNAPKICHS